MYLSMYIYICIYSFCSYLSIYIYIFIYQYIYIYIYIFIFDTYLSSLCMEIAWPTIPPLNTFLKQNTLETITIPMGILSMSGLTMIVEF